MKGQVAFESLFLLLVTLTAAIGITTLYFQTHDDTMALSIARTETLSQISLKKETFVIEYVQIEKSLTDTNLIIKINPTTTLDTDSIKNKIAASTKYKNINIILE